MKKFKFRKKKKKIIIFIFIILLLGLFCFISFCELKTNNEKIINYLLNETTFTSDTNKNIIDLITSNLDYLLDSFYFK